MKRMWRLKSKVWYGVSTYIEQGGRAFLVEKRTGRPGQRPVLTKSTGTYQEKAGATAMTELRV